MKLTTLPSEFQKALPILEKIKDAGYEAYFVGGSVRDAVLGRPIHDVDIATSAYPAEVKQIFKKTVDVGIEHGTVLVLFEDAEYEITTFRTEEAYVDYRRPSAVHFVRSLEEDLKRRDFTVNAFALDEEATIIDLFGGLEDLEARRLRAVGIATERFNEDALRIMRGFRFAATLNFDIEVQTLDAMRETAPLLEKISIERIFIELDRLFQAEFWQKGLRYLLETGAVAYLPDLSGQDIALEQMCQRLPEDFRFTSPEQAWAFLLVTLAKTAVQPFLKTWKTSTHFQKTVAQYVTIYQLRQERELTRQDVYHHGREALEVVEYLRQAEGLSVDFDRISSLDRALTIHDKHEIVLTGADLIKDLGFKQGKVLGEMLKAIEEAIVAGDLANEKSAIIRFIEEKSKHE